MLACTQGFQHKLMSKGWAQQAAEGRQPQSTSFPKRRRKRGCGWPAHLVCAHKHLLAVRPQGHAPELLVVAIPAQTQWAGTWLRGQHRFLGSSGARQTRQQRPLSVVKKAGHPGTAAGHRGTAPPTPLTCAAPCPQHSPTPAGCRRGSRRGGGQ